MKSISRAKDQKEYFYFYLHTVVKLYRKMIHPWVEKIFTISFKVDHYKLSWSDENGKSRKKRGQWLPDPHINLSATTELYHFHI